MAGAPVGGAKLALRRGFQLGALGLATLLLVVAQPLWQEVSVLWQRVLLPWIGGYQAWAEQVATLPAMLPVLAFLGGLLVSLSPCILSLLPVHLSYLGTLTPRSRREALGHSLAFVAGAVTLFAAVGLFAGFASALLLTWRGPVYMGMGVIVWAMGLRQLGFAKWSLPKLPTLHWLGHPYVVGLSFATIVSPCAGSIAVSTLVAAAGTGSPLLGALVMICYGFGYTAVVFLAGVWVGFAQYARRLTAHSGRWLTVGGWVLTIAGMAYIYWGAQTLWAPTASSSGIE
ncbi:MAG: cytochrome c biogenesis protein CcdA [Oscillatoriales cyanobacterium SM2_1_8]|nr:cytochrome c biogenesis protein CcdA [Oscillatoriales cyanobacterium SM2_1_8]